MQANNFIKFLALILFGVLAGVVSSYFAFKNSSVSQVINKEEKIYVEENTVLTSKIKEVKDAVVGIKSGNITGSGLIVTSDGLIVTLASNVPTGSGADIIINGEENIPYQILKRDMNSNLALVKVDKNNLLTRGFFDLSQLEEGKRVFLISKPYLNGKFLLSANEGIVKSFDENNIVTNMFEAGRVDGAPVFDIEGNILGLSYKDAENIVNVIPVSTIKSFVGL